MQFVEVVKSVAAQHNRVVNDERAEWLECDTAAVTLMRYMDLTDNDDEATEYLEAQGATFFMKETLRAHGAVSLLVTRAYAFLCAEQMCYILELSVSCIFEQVWNAEDRVWTSIDLEGVPAIRKVCYEHGVKLLGNYNDDNHFN